MGGGRRKGGQKGGGSGRSEEGKKKGEKERNEKAGAVEGGGPMETPAQTPPAVSRGPHAALDSCREPGRVAGE